uniref:Uncharacterized protein n=1 Tax=Peronospora matthiolae TaxID=2874970 RepID=A0AAV1V1X9_9STRA
MVNPRITPRRTEFPRLLPADSLLETSESELALSNLDALRLNALKLAPTPTSAAELHRMWIPCPHAIERKHLAEVLDELAKDDQPQLWNDARQARLLRDFKLIPNAGIRLTCTAYDTASKLSLVKLNAFGSQIQVARFSKYGSRYYVDLVRLPDEVTDRVIFDWFAEHGAPPTCVLPTFVRNDLPSRERTVSIGRDQAPSVLVHFQDNPLCEIEFSSPDDGMVKLRACFVNHKVASYNRVKPPSILLRQEADAARKATESAASSPSSLFSPSGAPIPSDPKGYVSSLRESICRMPPDLPADSPLDSSLDLKADSSGYPVAPSDHDTSRTDDVAMSDDDVGSTMGDAVDESVSDPSDFNMEAFLGEVINAPKINPGAPLWTKAGTNRQALYGRSGADLVEAKSIKYDFNAEAGTAQATGLVKPNYYHSLCFEDADPDVAQCQYDLEVRHEEGNETCMECGQVDADKKTYISIVAPYTIGYEVESMKRLELTKCVDSFLKDLSYRTPLEQLDTVEANPGLMLPAMASKDRLDTLAHYRSVCRLLAHTRPGTSVAQSQCSRVLHATGKAKTMLKNLLGHGPPILAQDKKALFAPSSWDLVLHIMALTVYHDPIKLFVLMGTIPDFLVDLRVPLLSDNTLWLLGFSYFAKDLLQYETVPDSLKSLVQAVQALKPNAKGSPSHRLHFWAGGMGLQGGFTQCEWVEQAPPSVLPRSTFTISSCRFSRNQAFKSTVDTR